MTGLRRTGTVSVLTGAAVACSPGVAWANAMLPPGGLANGLANDYGTSMLMLALALVAVPFAVAAYLGLRRMARTGPVTPETRTADASDPSGTLS